MRKFDELSWRPLSRDMNFINESETHTWVDEDELDADDDADDADDENWICETTEEKYWELVKYLFSSKDSSTNRISFDQQN